MSSWLEQKYISLLAPSLQKFSQVDKEVYNFRCPFCGDSSKNKNKARGYITWKKDRFGYYCHNCGKGCSFAELLEFVSDSLHTQFVIEKVAGKQSSGIPASVKPKQRIIFDNDPLKRLVKVSALPHTHSCKKYVDSRLIPTKFHYKLFYCSQFANWVNSIIPGKFDIEGNAFIHNNKPRLIIPLLDRENKMYGFQGRALDPEDKLRYITIMLDETKAKVYGLDAVDFNRTFYVTEGPFDSMFVPNAIASLGGQIDTTLQSLNFNQDNCVIVYDNQPRNKQVVKNIRRSITKGFKVVIWPDSFGEKDINDWIIDNRFTFMQENFVSGPYTLLEWQIKELQAILQRNTYSGLQAELELEKWKRC